MPMYQIFHAVPLSPTQQQSLASAITEIHSRTFTAMTALTNVDFINVTGKSTFIGGHLRPWPSTVHASVRDGPSRTPEMYASLCTQVNQAWDRIVDATEKDGQLRVFVTGGFITGIEGGYLLPPAGGDKAWLAENLDRITKNAENGHQESMDMLESINIMKAQSGEVVIG